MTLGVFLGLYFPAAMHSDKIYMMRLFVTVNITTVSIDPDSVSLLEDEVLSNEIDSECKHLVELFSEAYVMQYLDQAFSSFLTTEL